MARTYGCDANGNVVAGNELYAVYDFMNLPRIVDRIGTPHPGSRTFRYDANGQRFEEVTGSGETTRFGPKGYEKVTGTSVAPNIRHRHELGPVIVSRTNGVDGVTYATRDRLGSLAAVLPTNPFKGDLRSCFADPYSAWQRGCNENLNGLLRQYFPKGCDPGAFTDGDIQKVQDALNRRPRKRLGFRTPQQMFDRSFKHCALQS